MIKLYKHVNSSAMWAIEGIKDTFKEETMAKVQFSFCVIQVVIGLILGFTFYMLIIQLCMSVILISGELMNTAIENVCDLVTQDKKQLVKRAKDSAGAAVFIISVFNWILFLVFVGVSYYA